MTKASKDSFSSGLDELEAITTWFESEQADLDAGLVKFERGMELIATLREQLNTVENRVEKIKSKFEITTSASATELEPPPDDDLGLF